LLNDVLKIDPVRRSLRALARNRAGFRLLNSLSGPRRVFVSFPEAWSVCEQLPQKSHENATLVDSNFWLSVKTRPSDYPVLFWLSRVGLSEGLKVFDFGGGIGQTYYQYSRLLQTVGPAQWTVMDLRDVIAGRDVAREQRASALRFTSSLRDCADCNVFLAAGSLHYWEHSIAELADALGGLPQHVFINRSPTRQKGQSFVSIQKGAHWAVPCIVRSSKDLEKEFAQLGYEVVDHWPVLEKALEFPLLPEHVAPYAGYYFRRRSQADSRDNQSA
jgi:putative methyltransferase (TIGR04325 family)